MATTTAKYVVKAIADKQICNWQIKDGEKLVDECSAKTPDEAADRLQEALDNLYGYNVSVILSKLSKEDKAQGGATKTSNFFYKVDLNKKDSSAINGTGDVWQQKYYEERENGLIAKHEEAMSRMEQRLEELSNKINGIGSPGDEEDKEEEEDMTTILIKEGLPYLKIIAEKTFGLTPPISAMNGIHGAEPEPEPQTIKTSGLANGTPEAEHQKKLCATACGQLLAIDGEAGEHLMLLAQFAAQNINGYYQALNMLKMQL